MCLMESVQVTTRKIAFFFEQLLKLSHTSSLSILSISGKFPSAQNAVKSVDIPRILNDLKYKYKAWKIMQMFYLKTRTILFQNKMSI